MSRSMLSSEMKNRQVITWLTVLLALIWFYILYQSSFSILFHNWNEYGTYSHGYLTILLSVFLIFMCINKNALAYSGPSVLSGIFLFIISVVWMLAYFAMINTFQMLCIPFIVYFTFTYFYGFKRNSILIVPIFLLLLTIPVWGIFLPYLQDIAVKTTRVVLSFSSLNYQVIENQIIFPSGIFEIEESCSGLRYILVGVLLAIVYGFLNYQSYLSTLLLIAITTLLMLLANLVRIIVIIILGVTKGMDYPLVQDHDELGWVMFAVFLLPMFLIASIVKPNIWMQNWNLYKTKSNYVKRIRWQKWVSSFFIYLILVSVAPLYAHYIENNIKNHARLSDHKPELTGGWSGPIIYGSKWSPRYELYSYQYTAQYINQEHYVDLNIFLYTKEGANGELVNSNNKLVDHNKWDIKNIANDQVLLVDDQEAKVFVNKVQIESKNSNECYRVWYWFTVDNLTFTNKLQVKLNEVLMMFKKKSGSAIVSISTSCNKKSDSILESYISNNYKLVNRLITWNLNL